MVEVWQFWEFEHDSHNIVRVIDAPSGLELFAVDVFQIIAPMLNDEKVTLINAPTNQRFVTINCSIVTVNTLNALAIHSLSGIVKADVIRRFMQWVRSNIAPIFRKDINPEYFFNQINFYRQQLIGHYLYLKSQSPWEVERENIELYFQLFGGLSDVLLVQKMEIYSDLKKSHNPDWMTIIKQGLMIQAFNSIATKKAIFGNLQYLVLYFQILESNHW
ncbi:hypothetical protein LC605_20220 [Nostoc sp. CHAB 5836]|uniref:hypothetical protein n=1 Tax=Nostoc sp. CHAB 5836 TaxID=2780404 RepID=UPI001E38B277|nr:hypothetical protein [Nostoc sp. CHAB 5836]MCC5617370.1 hypothetical protein [Nostoc sp. CHAB 5836]